MNKSGHQILAEIDSLGIKKVTALTIDETRMRIAKKQRTYVFGWRKKNIFWDFPYWSSLFIRHNLDVMHIEKNVFDNIFNTIMNVKGKTKDTTKSREELNMFCRKPELGTIDVLGRYPKASYMLDNDEKIIFLKWIEDLKFPDGYASNMARCVNLSTLQMFVMKSHNCHVMMQQILHVAFKELLPNNVWKAITDLCLFFKELTSPNIQVDNLRQMQQNIPVILCKLERIFPPSFFDSMEHLSIHLADETMIAGPVQYRWTYPFERYNIHNAFEWDPSMYSREVIRTAWIRMAMIAYRDFVSATKKLVLTGKTPLYLEEHVETTWKAYWDMPEVKRISEQASKNQRSEPGGPGTGITIHHGGSRSAIDHAEHQLKLVGKSEKWMFVDRRKRFGRMFVDR